ncbi:MAG: lipid A biosynthesis acyltransferase [Solimonas sp.]
MSDAAAWQRQRERSTVFMLRLIVGIGRVCGRGCARLILYPTVLYFLLAGGAQGRASREYLHRVLGRAPTLRERWRHFFCFASCMLDRLFLVGGYTRGLDVRVTRDAGAQAIFDSGRGAIILLAHVGSFETIRVTGSVTKQMPLRVVMDRAHGGVYTAILEKLNPELAAKIIDAANRGPDFVLQLKAALEHGELVCLMADRARDGEATVRVPLLGGEVALPMAPWIVAGLLQVPVITGFAVYRGGGRYDAMIEAFAGRIHIERRTRAADVQRVAADYAKRVEHVLRDAPYNWFNFYDYWS